MRLKSPQIFLKNSKYFSTGPVYAYKLDSKGNVDVATQEIFCTLIGSPNVRPGGTCSDNHITYCTFLSGPPAKGSQNVATWFLSNTNPKLLELTIFDFCIDKKIIDNKKLGCIVNPAKTPNDAGFFCTLSSGRLYAITSDREKSLVLSWLMSFGANQFDKINGTVYIVNGIETSPNVWKYDDGQPVFSGMIPPSASSSGTNYLSLTGVNNTYVPIRRYSTEEHWFICEF